MEETILRLNEQIYSFWNKDYIEAVHKEDYHNYLSCFLRKINKSILTIIGFNPSLNKDGYKSCFEDTQYKDLEFLIRIHRDNNKNFGKNFHENINELHDIEDHIGQKHPYTTKLKQVAENIGIKKTNFLKDVTVLDLFYFRDTNQKNLERRLIEKIPKSCPTQYQLTSFAREQLPITMKALMLSDPDIILVANAKASNVFIDYNKEYITEEQYGYIRCYVYSLNDKQVPIFFSSMLSGQRALDNFSLRRLQWDMKKIMERVHD
ncbi:hypothetical protein ABE237_06550 [Brevibacillus formosus]|uniref:hypothetical protein n=1 Tax=Brevibacillus formosus TaxID=54913 RepID=UPI0018CCBDFD|nr:hypothetical protein [Brevibacillus formosus]MBG9943824.1 hypothetical protein [Brevibacillus formosus]